MAFLLVFLLVGELISSLGVVLPGNVIGMLLLTAALALRLVRVEQVSAASDLLLDNLAFFFVPPAVGVMLYFDLIARHWAAIATSIVVGVVAVLAAVGLSAQLLLRRGDRKASSTGGNKI